MSEVLAIVAIVGRALSLVFIAIVIILIWKTAEYFNTLPESDKNRHILSWDVLMLFCWLVCLVTRLIVI